MTIVHKANVVSVTDGLFREAALHVAKDFAGSVMRETRTLISGNAYVFPSSAPLSGFRWSGAVLELQAGTRSVPRDRVALLQAVVLSCKMWHCVATCAWLAQVS